LVVQASLTPETRHLFNRVTLRRMKPTAILINTVRGPIVEDAVATSSAHHSFGAFVICMPRRGGLDIDNLVGQVRLDALAQPSQRLLSPPTTSKNCIARAGT
jgi:hypothetical protein